MDNICKEGDDIRNDLQVMIFKVNKKVVHEDEDGSDDEDGGYGGYDVCSPQGLGPGSGAEVAAGGSIAPKNLESMQLS